MKEKIDTVIFYYVFLQNNFKDVVNQQLAIIFMSGIYKDLKNIFLCCSYIQQSTYKQNLYYIYKLAEKFKKIKIIQCGKSIPFVKQQISALQLLVKYAWVNEKSNIYYIQTMGTTKPNKQSWRLVLMYNLFNDYQKKLQLLQQYNAVGSLYTTKSGHGYRPHYPGNFWLTKSQYVKTLDIQRLRQQPESRWSSQFFIGTSNKFDQKKMYNMIKHPIIDLYDYRFMITEAIDDLD